MQCRGAFYTPGTPFAGITESLHHFISLTQWLLWADVNFTDFGIYASEPH